MIPHSAPLVQLIIKAKLLGLSLYSQSKTINPVKGITAISPANVGNRRPICVHKRIILTLMNNLITNRIPHQSPGIEAQPSAHCSLW